MMPRAGRALEDIAQDVRILRRRLEDDGLEIAVPIENHRKRIAG
jgi:hypothetical protein